MAPHKQIYLVTGHTDMRKSIDSLSLLVSDALEMDPLIEAWFAGYLQCDGYSAHARRKFHDALTAQPKKQAKPQWH